MISWRRHDLHGRTPILVHPLNRVRIARWFQNKNFSTDWATEHISVWHRLLASWREQPIRVLEIGSWEGRSALFFLNYLRRSTIVCIDTFQGNESIRHNPALARELPHIEARFDRNLAPFAHRVEKLRSTSTVALDVLIAAGRVFELAYIDGDHRCDVVWEDSIRVWKLVPPGGIVIWDDYGWRPGKAPADRPQPAIDAFLAEQAGRYRLLVKGYQVAVERLL